MKSIIAHFQKLFDVNSIEGIFPRMNEVYLYLGESHNLLNNLRDILSLGENPFFFFFQYSLVRKRVYNMTQLKEKLNKFRIGFKVL